MNDITTGLDGPEKYAPRRVRENMVAAGRAQANDPSVALGLPPGTIAATPPTIEGLASAASKKALDDLDQLFSHNDRIIALVRQRADQLEAANNAKRDAYKSVLEQMAAHAISSVQSAKLLLDSLHAAESVLHDTPAPTTEPKASNGAGQ